MTKKTRLERRKHVAFAAFRIVRDLFIIHYRENYKPVSYLTINEQLLGFRGRFRICIPNKPNKCGIKIVMLVANSTKYTVDAQPYLRTSTQTEGKPLGKYFLKKLVELFIAVIET